MSGVDLKTVQELLGRQTYQMTLKYAHLSPEHRQPSVDILARRIEHGTNLSQAVKVPILENLETVAA